LLTLSLTGTLTLTRFPCTAGKYQPSYTVPGTSGPSGMMTW